MEARWAGTVAAGPPVASTADTFSCQRIAGPLTTGRAGGAAALTKGTEGTRFLTPASLPPGVTALAVPTFYMTGLSKPAAGAPLSAALPEGARRAWLLALGPIPARPAGLTVACDWRARCILLTVATAFSALYPIAARAAGQLTSGAVEAGRAGAVAGSAAALTSHTLAAAAAVRPPPARQAGAAAGVLQAGRGVALAAEAAAAAPPAGRADAGSRGLVTARRWVALARATARG